MKKLNIKMQSVTYALKAQNALSRYGITAYVKRNPAPKQSEGCGYYLVVADSKNMNISCIMQENNIPFVEMEWGS